MVELDGHLGYLLQISTKYSKIITYDLINIINRFYNIIIRSKNTYKPWVNVDQIHGLSKIPRRLMEDFDLGGKPKLFQNLGGNPKFYLNLSGMCWKNSF